MSVEHRRATILVIDDEPMERMLLDDILTSQGYQVVLACSGREALEKYDGLADQIDLILLDWTLPDILGIDVHQEIKARGTQKGRFTPVIMVTARDDITSKLRGLQDGLEDYVTKPYNRSELLARISNMLRIRQTVKQLERTEGDLRIRALEAQRSKLYTIGEMVFEILHEINNPLNGILNYAELAEGEIEGPGQDDARELVRIIHSEANRIHVLVKRLSTLRRPDLGTSVLDLTRVLDEALTITKFLLKKSSVEVVRRYEPDRYFLRGESSRLIQVFLNLIYNAVYALDEKFGSQPGKRLSFEVTDFDGGSGIVVRVRDNGIGIAPENLARILEPDFTTKRAGEGTGLGLSIAESIIREHGGTIKVSSVQGEFTEFEMRMPAIGSTSERPPLL